MGEVLNWLKGYPPIYGKNANVTSLLGGKWLVPQDAETLQVFLDLIRKQFDAGDREMNLAYTFRMAGVGSFRFCMDLDFKQTTIVHQSSAVFLQLMRDIQALMRQLFPDVEDITACLTTCRPYVNDKGLVKSSFHLVWPEVIVNQQLWKSVTHLLKEEIPALRGALDGTLSGLRQMYCDKYCDENGKKAQQRSDVLFRPMEALARVAEDGSLEEVEDEREFQRDECILFGMSPSTPLSTCSAVLTERSQSAPGVPSKRRKSSLAGQISASPASSGRDTLIRERILAAAEKGIIPCGSGDNLQVGTIKVKTSNLLVSLHLRFCEFKGGDHRTDSQFLVIESSGQVYQYCSKTSCVEKRHQTASKGILRPEIFQSADFEVLFTIPRSIAPSVVPKTQVSCKSSSFSQEQYLKRQRCDDFSAFASRSDDDTTANEESREPKRVLLDRDGARRILMCGQSTTEQVHEARLILENDLPIYDPHFRSFDFNEIFMPFTGKTALWCNILDLISMCIVVVSQNGSVVYYTRVFDGQTNELQFKRLPCLDGLKNYCITTMPPGSQKCERLDWKEAIAASHPAWFTQEHFLPFGTPAQRAKIPASIFNRFTGFKHYRRAHELGFTMVSCEEHVGARVCDPHEAFCMEPDDVRKRDMEDAWSQLQSKEAILARQNLIQDLNSGKLQNPSTLQLCQAVAPFLFHLIVVACNRPVQEFWAIMQGQSPQSFEMPGYFLGWLASIVQNPGMKTGTSIVLLGCPGSGKNFLVEFFIRFVIGEKWAATITTVEHLTGRFNMVEVDKLLSFLNEVEIRKRGKDMHNKLKSMITDVDRVTEPKGVDPYTDKNYCNYIIASNSDSPLWIEPNCRRYVPLQFSDVFAQCASYFDALQGECNHDEFGFCVYLYLINLDLRRWNVRAIPKTAMRAEIIDDCRHPVHKFLQACVENTWTPKDQFCYTSAEQQQQHQFRNPFLEAYDGIVTCSWDVLWNMFQKWNDYEYPRSNHTVCQSKFKTLVRKLGKKASGAAEWNWEGRNHDKPRFFRASLESIKEALNLA